MSLAVQIIGAIVAAAAALFVLAVCFGLAST